jgi:SET domain-containing protein
MLNKKIKPGESKIEGIGLIAQGHIKKGEVVWKLDVDEKRLTLEELKKLPPDRQKLAYQHKDKYIIVTDSSEYMNHSCDANTWWTDDETLVASRDILPGEDVTYDYATAEIDEKFRNEWKCNCKAKNCRKVVRSDDCLDLEFQKRYKGHLPSWTVEYINRHKKYEK